MDPADLDPTEVNAELEALLDPPGLNDELAALLDSPWEPEQP
jgi:hypothetical protein